MKEFDKDGDGTVNCAEFLLTFFRVGFDTRNKALHRYFTTVDQVLSRYPARTFFYLA